MESLPTQDQSLPKATTKPATEEHAASFATSPDCSSPVQPFPELDLALDQEADQASPTFAHEVDTHLAPAALSLPAPTVEKLEYVGHGYVTSARLEWMQGKEGEEEERGMREATQRGLEWARKMIGEEFGLDSKDSNDPEQDSAEAE